MVDAEQKADEREDEEAFVLGDGDGSLFVGDVGEAFACKVDEE